MRAAGGAEPRAARPCGDILCAAKSNCIVENAETGQQEMDAKNTVVYLDTIKQIMSVVKQGRAASANDPYGLAVYEASTGTFASDALDCVPTDAPTSPKPCQERAGLTRTARLQ